MKGATHQPDVTAAVAADPIVRNMTPHAVMVRNADGEIESIPPDGLVRVSTTPVAADPIGGFATVEVSYGEITGLPEFCDGVFYIVSLVVVAAARHAGRRVDDLLTPYNVVRDNAGAVLYCESFARG